MLIYYFNTESLFNILNNSYMNKEFTHEEIDDEIDLRILQSIFLRNKNFIIFFTLISTLISIIQFIFFKPIWQGSFDIIINEKFVSKNEIKKFIIEANTDLKKKKRLNQKILNLSGSLSKKIASNETNNVNTKKQNLILNSPSVLIPVFNEYKIYNMNDVKKFNISYSKWKSDYLLIDHEKKSNLILVNYQSANKEHLLRILNLISENYRDFSAKKYTSNTTIIDNSLIDLENKINVLRKKSSSDFDNIILSFFDDELQLAKLSLKNNKPFVKITKPIIEKKPIQPKTFNLILVLITFTSFYLLAVMKEKISGKIFELNILVQSIPYKYLETFYKNDPKLITKSIINKLNLKPENKVAVISLTNQFFKKVNDNNIKMIDGNIRFEFIKFENYEELKNYNKIILLAEKGKISKNNLRIINSYLSLHKDKINGFFILDFKN